MRQQPRATSLTILIPALVLSVTAVMTSAAFAQTLTPDQIVEKHLAALGGREAVAKVTSRKATGTIVVSTPGGNISGPIEMMAKAPTKMRSDIRLDLTPLGAQGELVMTQLFDGASGWMLNSMQGDAPMDGDQLAGAKNTYFPSPLLNYKEHGVTLTLEPNEKVNDRDAVVLRLTPKSGPSARLFFDAQTFLIVRSVSKVMTAAAGEVEQVNESSDYRSVDGVKVAFTINQAAGGQFVTIKFDKVENNVPIDDGVFIKK